MTNEVYSNMSRSGTLNGGYSWTAGSGTMDAGGTMPPSEDGKEAGTELLHVGATMAAASRRMNG
jgi:hypothetical protein